MIQSRHNTHIPWLIPLLLLVCWLGAQRLTVDVLFVDEYWSIRNAGGAYFGPLSPFEIWTTMAEVDPGGMGIGYQWALAGWFALTGTSPFTLRVFSLLAGLLAVALVYRTGRDLFTPRIGLYAAVLLGFTVFFINYLHEGRAYTLFMLLATLCIWLYARLDSQSQHDRLSLRTLIGLTLALAAIFYTHYVGLVMGAVIAAAHLLRFRRSRDWWMILVALIAAGLLFLPWLGVTLGVVQTGAEQSREATSMTAPQVIESFLHVASNGNLAWVVLLLMLALWAVRSHLTRLIWLWLSLTIIAVLLVNARIPFMVHPRYLILLLPPVMLLMAIAIDDLRQRGIPAILILLAWCLIGLYQYANPAYISDIFGQIYRAPRPGLMQGIDVIRERAESDDLALFHIMPPGYEPFSYFVIPYWLHDLPLTYDQYGRMNNSFQQNDNAYLEDVYAVLDGIERVWTLRVPDVPTSNLFNVAQYALDTSYLHCEQVIRRDDLWMDLYVSRVSPGPAVTFSTPDDTTLTLSVVEDTRLTPESLSQVWAWQYSDPVPPDYTIALHFLSADGTTLLAQMDYHLAQTAAPVGCQAFQLDLSGLRADTYRLDMVIYDPQTGERFPGQRIDSDEPPVERLTLDMISLPPD